MTVVEKQVHAGVVINYTNPTSTTIASKEIVVLGSTRIGIANAEILAGAEGSLTIGGVAELDAIDGSGTAFAVADPLYYNETSDIITTESSGNIPAGWCIRPKTTAQTTVLMLLNGISGK